jgi:hypothetical protein
MEQRWVGNTAFANELPDSLVVLVKFIELVVIGAIDCLSGTIIGIGGVANTFLVTNSKVGIGDPMTSVPDPDLQIKPMIDLKIGIGYHYHQVAKANFHHRLLPSVTEYPRVNLG